MRVEFRTRKLARLAVSHDEAIRAYGQQIGIRLIAAINILQAAPNPRTLAAIQSLRFHALRGDRKGQHSITLTGNWRLIVEVDAATKTVTIVDVADYH